MRTGKELSGKIISDVTYKLLSFVIENLYSKKIIPTLTVVYENDNDANRMYFKSILRSCKELKICVDIKYFDKLRQDDILQICKRIKNPIIFLGNFNAKQKELISKFCPSKYDVDCCTTFNRGELFLGRTPYFEPCTPKGIVALLDWNMVLQGSKVLIIGRGDLVGKPLAIMLDKMNCTVTLAHSKTKNLFAECVNADIIISCVGDYKSLSQTENGLLAAYKHKLKEKVIIDVGTNVVEGHIRGDFSEEFKSNFGMWTPKTNCIGLLTTATLCENVISFYKKSLDKQVTI